MQDQLDQISDSSSDLSEDLFRDVDVLSDEDKIEFEEINFFNDAIFKNEHGESILIGSKGEILSKMATLKKASTFLSH